MRPGRQDLNVIFFTFRSCRHLDGRQTPIFENFPIRHIFLKICFFNIKMKKARSGTRVGAGSGLGRVLFGLTAPC